MAECDTRVPQRQLQDSTQRINNRVNRALRESRTAAATSGKSLQEELFNRLGFTRIDPRTPFEIEIFGWPATHIHLMTRAVTKYQNVSSNFWSFVDHLGTEGFSPTMRVGDIRIGSDKLGHFFQQGWQYYRAVHIIDDPMTVDQATRAGRHQELTYFGLGTTSVYSRADLKANVAGLRFYESLTTNPNANFDIRQHVTQEWNEEHLTNFYHPDNWLQVWRKLLSGTWTGEWRSAPGGNRQPVSITLDWNARGQLVGNFLDQTGFAWGSYVGNVTARKTKFGTTNTISGLKISYAWSVPNRTGRGKWETKRRSDNAWSESSLIGTIGEGASEDNRGFLDVTRA